MDVKKVITVPACFFGSLLTNSNRLITASPLSPVSLAKTFD
jgi:hypothetical protein